MSLFELKSANAGYNGKAVLKDISFGIDAGERVALVGKSGAGKSTLLRLLFEQQPDQVALVPQELALVQTLSVFHNVYIGRLNRHPTWYNLVNLAWPLRKEVHQVRAVTERVGLEDKLFAPVGELSGGQQQRTAVARALHQGGRVLFGDEPVSPVDGHQSHAMLSAINEDFETVLLAMHDIELALAFSDRVIGIKDGAVAMDEPSTGLKATDLDFLYKTP